MKKQILLFGLLLSAGAALAQTTVGYTEKILSEPTDDAVGTLAAPALSGTTNVTISSEAILGSSINWNGNATIVKLNGNKGYSREGGQYLRKTVKDTYENQNVGYELTVAEGYKMDISNLKARILVADNTYNWYVEVLNSSGVAVYQSAEQTTTTESTAALDVDLSENKALANLTGKVSVFIWIKQNGSSKRFSLNYLTVDVKTAEDVRTTYAVTTSAGEGGTVSPASGNFVEGSDVVLKATPNTGYIFGSWLIDGVEIWDNPYTISSIAAAHTVSASFTPLLKVSFAKGDATGDLPAEVDYADEYAVYKTPNSYYLVKDGYTFVGWSDGSKVYGVGETLLLMSDIELVPVFEENAFELGQTEEEVVVDWNFAMNNGAPELKCEGNTKYYVAQAVYGSDVIDVAMFIDTQEGAGVEGKRGKVNVQDVRAQVNEGTVFKIPVVAGAKVSVVATNGTNASVASMTFNGNEATEYDEDTKTLSYTVVKDGTLTIIDKGSNLYPSLISVVYPAVEPTAVETVEAVEKANSAEVYDIAGRKLNKAQRGLNIVGGKLILVK